MNAITNFGDFSAVQTADEFSALMAKLETEIADAQDVEVGLARAFEEAMFNGGDVAKARSVLEETRSHISDLRIALAGAQKRHRKASEQETSQYLDDLEAANDADVADLQKGCAQEGRHIEDLRACLAENERLCVTIERRNMELMSGGRMNRTANVKKVRRENVGEVTGPRSPGNFFRRPAASLDRFLHDFAEGKRVSFAGAHGLGNSAVGDDSIGSVLPRSQTERLARAEKYHGT